MSAGRRRRLLVGAIGLSLLVGVGIAPHAQPTDASWVRSEFTTSSVFTAYDVPEPVSSASPGCVANGGLLGINPTITIYWRVPAGVSGYALANAEFGLKGDTGLLEPVLTNLLGNISTTGTAAAYTTVVSKGLLTGILGGSTTLGVRFIGPGGWRSDWLVATGSLSLAGLNPVCVMSTADS